MVPSLEEVMLFQFFELPSEIQVAPESVDVQMLSPTAAAASLVPSLEDVMANQFFELPTEIQVPPESVDVQMFPP